MWWLGCLLGGTKCTSQGSQDEEQEDGHEFIDNDTSPAVVGRWGAKSCRCSLCVLSESRSLQWMTGRWWGRYFRFDLARNSNVVDGRTTKSLRANNHASVRPTIKWIITEKSWPDDEGRGRNKGTASRMWRHQAELRYYDLQHKKGHVKGRRVASFSRKNGDPSEQRER